MVRDEEGAAFDFALANQARDRAFRARVYPLFAFPFAVVLLVAARPDEPYLALMALYGAAVYSTLAQTFQGYSESHGGPLLLATLPLRGESAFRIGAEKAFLVGLAAPIYLFLGVALFSVSLSGRGLPLLLGARHALVAGLFALLLCAFFFERRRVKAFAEADRGVFREDLGGGPFLAVLLAAGLALLLRLTYAWKRRRADPRQP
ncbi:MAG: hypothetical protein HY812_14455 [Planctomycetes bacterium]|nr:hypothetical protein [Planctomycetota bacterium]